MEASSGNDTVTDFALGTDKVAFDPSSGVTSFAQLTITKVGSDALVSWAGGNSVLLQGIKASNLTASDFQFGSASFAAAAAPLVAKSAPAESALHDQALAPVALSTLSSSDQLFDVGRIAPAATALHGPDQVASTFSADFGAIAQPAEVAMGNSPAIHFEFSPDLGMSGSDHVLVHHDAGATII